MDVQSAANLNIPEGSVRNIHDKDKRLLWSAVGYNVRYDGDTTQQTYTGKNLSPTLNNYTWHGYHTNELTVTNSSVTAVTSPEYSSTGVYISKSEFPSICPALGQTGNVVSCTISLDIASDVRIGYEGTTSGTFVRDSLPASKTRVSFATKEAVNNISFYVTNKTGATIVISEFQVESGSTATAYEPYVGGIPAPNPDYPQDVNVVQGKQTILASGKNLFLIPETETKNGVTLTKNSDGTFNLSGTATATATFNIKLDAMIESGTYTLSKSGGNFIAVVQDYLNASWLSQLITLNYNVDSVTTSINPVGNRVSFVVQARNGITYNLQNVKIQLEKNSSATQFEVHQNKIVNVDLRGKNLFDNTKSEAYISKASLQTISNGIRAITTTSSNSATFAVMIVGKVEDFLGDEITLSYSSAVSSSSNTARVYIGLCDANGNNRSAKTYISATENGVGTYNIGDAIDFARPYLCLAFYSTTTTTTVGDYVDYNNVQLEIGDAATTYQPYHAPIELCKIGNYQDYIYKGADGWYVHKEVYGTILNGSENITEYNVKKSILGVRVPIEYNALHNVLPKSNYFYSVLFADFYSEDTRKYGTVSTHNSFDVQIIYMTVPNSLVTTVNELKSWLSTHNTKVYYVLATPTNTKITDTTITSQLDAIHDWLTRYDYYGMVTGNLPMIINRTGLT